MHLDTNFEMETSSSLETDTDKYKHNRLNKFTCNF